MIGSVVIDEPQSERPDDRELLRLLFVSSYERLVRAATLVLGSQDLGRESVHDAFLSLFAKPRVLRDRAAAEAYLQRAVIRSAKSRRTRLWVTRHFEAPFENVVEPGAETPDQPLPITEAVRRLPVRQREVIALAYFFDLPEIDIARRLGVSVGAVKSYKFRALRALDAQLRGREVEREHD